MTDIAVVFAEPIATELDALREQRRQARSITYDCQQALVTADLRVTCRKGKALTNNSHDGGLNLVAVLRGFTAGCCKVCQDYQPGDPE